MVVAVLLAADLAAVAAVASEIPSCFSSVLFYGLVTTLAGLALSGLDSCAVSLSFQHRFNSPHQSGAAGAQLADPFFDDAGQRFLAPRQQQNSYLSAVFLVS